MELKPGEELATELQEVVVQAGEWERGGGSENLQQAMVSGSVGGRQGFGSRKPDSSVALNCQGRSRALVKKSLSQGPS